MEVNNLKKLRKENDLTQQEVANILNCTRSAYNNWERSVNMIPLAIVDRLSSYYHVSLGYILGLSDNRELVSNIREIDYNTLLTNLIYLKNINNDTYETIGNNIKCDRTICQKYFKGKIKIPMDRLIALTKLYNVSIDELCYIIQKDKIKTS